MVKKSLKIRPNVLWMSNCIKLLGSIRAKSIEVYKSTKKTKLPLIMACLVDQKIGKKKGCKQTY